MITFRELLNAGGDGQEFAALGSKAVENGDFVVGSLGAGEPHRGPGYQAYEGRHDLRRDRAERHLGRR